MTLIEPRHIREILARGKMRKSRRGIARRIHSWASRRSLESLTAWLVCITLALILAIALLIMGTPWH